MNHLSLVNLWWDNKYLIQTKVLKKKSSLYQHFMHTRHRMVHTGGLLLSSCFQGSPYRWEPVRFDRLPVKPVPSGFGLGRYKTGPNSKFKFKFKK